MKALLLVGGEGTRLHPLTWHLPKAMVPVLNRPFLEHTLAYLRRHGVDEVILAMGYLPTPIQAYFGDGSRFGVKLTYVVEKSPLGTGGALRHAAPLLESAQSFFVLNGDIFTDLDLTAMLTFHRKGSAQATIALTPVEDPSRFGVVVTDSVSRVTAFVEKPQGPPPSYFINAGIYILESPLLERLPAGQPSMLERGLFPQLAREGASFLGYPFKGLWTDMGTPQDYLALNLRLLLSQPPPPQESGLVHPGARLSGPVLVGRDAVVEAGAEIQGPCCLGEGCYLEAGARIRESVLWEGVRVGRGALVQRSVLASRCHIGEGCSLDNAVLGAGETVTPRIATTDSGQR